MAGLKYTWMDAFQSEAGPRPVVRLLLHTLASHMKVDGSGCFPGTRRLARETGLSRSTVLEAIAEARDVWVRVEERRGGRRGGSYFVYFPTIPESGPGARPLPDTEAVGEDDHFAGQSGRKESVKWSDSDAKVVGQADQSISGVSNRVATQRAHARASRPVVANALKEPPSGWTTPAHLADPEALWHLLTADERAYAATVRGAGGEILPRELGYLPADVLEQLQFQVASRDEGAA